MNSGLLIEVTGYRFSGCLFLVQTEVLPVILNYMISYPFLWIISMFLVHVAVVLGGREVHDHGVWMIVVQKQITVQRPGQPWVFSVPSAWGDSYRIQSQALLPPDYPDLETKASGSFLCQEGGRCGSSMPTTNHQKIRRLCQWCPLKSTKVFICWSLWGGSTEVRRYLIRHRNVVGVIGWKKVLNVAFLSSNSGKDWGSLARVSMKIQSFKQLVRSLA